MNLAQLETFLAVAREHSFTRAAEVLHLTQPTVSFHIQALEEYYGLRLFDRGNKAVTLTPAGARLERYIRQILELMEDAKKELDTMAGSVGGELLVGSSQTVGDYLLPALTARFVRQYPSVTPRLKIGNTLEVVHWVAEAELDLGVVEGEVADQRIRRHDWLRDRLVLVVAPDHPWATHTSLSAERLSEGRLILRESGSGTREVLADALALKHVSAGRLEIAEMGTLEAIKSAVEYGLGATFISPLAIEKELRLGTMVMVPVEDLDLSRQFYLVRGRSRFRSLAAEEFFRFLTEHGKSVRAGEQPAS